MNMTFGAMLAIAMTVQSAIAQQLAVAEPEFAGVMLLMGDTNAPAQQLEKQKCSTAAKASVGAAIFGIAKGRGMNIVNGSRSPIRASSKSVTRLIVKVGDNSKDPAEIVNVFRMESDTDKDKRVLIVGKVNFNASSSLDIMYIPFKGSKYGSSSYLLEFANLEPGEYAATLETSRNVFNLFGVD